MPKTPYKGILMNSSLLMKFLGDALNNKDIYRSMYEKV